MEMKRPRKRTSRMSNLGLSVVSAVIAVVLFVGVYEIVNNVRYSMWRKTFDNQGWFGKITVPSDNPVLMWEYRPYGEIEEIKINRWGFRDIDYESKEKSEDVLRVAFVGDSVTLGYTVGAEDTLVRQFEVEANRSSSARSVQALNFGIDGYHAVQIAELVRAKVLSFSPDIVVYAMCMNDFDFNQASGKKIRYFRKPNSWFLHKLDKLQRKMSRVDYHIYNYRKNKPEVFRSIVDMRDSVEQAGASLRVIVLPIFPESSFDEYPIRQMHDQIGEFFVRNGIGYLDLFDAFALQERPPRHFAADIWHPNLEGNRFIAQQAVAAILPD
jgi:lysophospholipase L1-like esterase